MIVIAKKVGRLANRLLLFSHFIAAAVEHGFRVANPAFARFSEFFPSTARDPLCRFPGGPRWPAVLANPYEQEALYQACRMAAHLRHRRQAGGRAAGLIRLRRDQHLDLDSETFLSTVRRHRTVFVQDWNFRSREGCRKHGEIIRQFFTPRPDLLEQARRAVEPARENGRFLVGVHVRRTDYADFKDGRHFYPPAEYRRLMRDCVATFGDREVSFLTCSDEPLPEHLGDELEVLPGPGSAIGDLYALAACDRILGPPSTYSRWASYWGRVPRLVVEEAGVPVVAGDFVIDETLGYGTLPKGSPQGSDP
jgi:hypothetical protein